MNTLLKILPILFIALFLVGCGTDIMPDEEIDMVDEGDDVVDLEDDELDEEFVDGDEDIDIGEPI